MRNSFSLLLGIGANVFLLIIISTDNSYCLPPHLKSKLMLQQIKVTQIPFGHREEKRASDLIREAQSLEEQGKIDDARNIYRRIINEFPAGTYEDETGVGSYAEDARDRLLVLDCMKQRDRDYSALSRDELVKAIKEGLKSNNPKRLGDSASCDFKVGKPETDAVWQIPADEAVNVIISLGTNLARSSLANDLSGNLVIKGTEGDEHVFLLKESSGQWKWKGYFTTNEKILTKLWDTKTKNKKSRKEGKEKKRTG